MFSYNGNSNTSIAAIFTLLLKIFIEELENRLKKLKIIYIICLIVFFLIFVGIYILLYFAFLSANKRRLNYMEIFYGINDSILKTTIINCHNFIHKLEKYESSKDENEDDLSDDLSIEKVKIKKGDRNGNNESLNNNKKSNYFADNIIFIILFGFFLIVYSFFIVNFIYIFKLSNESQLMHKFMTTLINYHMKIVEIFNSYRIYLFDETSIGMNNRVIIELLEESIYESYDSISSDVDCIQDYINSHIIMNEELKKVMNKGLCSYYITDSFNSEEECIKKYKNIINHDFIVFASYFIQEVRIRKNLAKYILNSTEYAGKLNAYRMDLWINDDEIPKYIKPKTNITKKFRFDLFNNETMHNYLNTIYMNIILPYIDTNRKALLKSLKLKVKNFYFIVYSCVDILILVFIFYIYWIPIVSFFNNIIYKTKNMLSIIPTNILIYKTNIEILKDLSKN